MKQLCTISLITFMTGCSNATLTNSIEKLDANEDMPSVEKSITLSEKKPYYSVQLHCSNFSLTNEEELVCQYWKNSNKLTQPININSFDVYESLNPIQELSPIEYNFFAETKVNYKGQVYKAHVFPNSRIQLNDEQATNLVCIQAACSQPFLWNFITEYTLFKGSQKNDNMFDIINSIYLDSYQQYMKNALPESGKLSSKIFFDNHTLGELVSEPYAIRNVNKQSPLKNSLNAYISGVNEEEKKLGFENNSLGINKFQVNIRDKIAYIKFMADEIDIKSSEQVLNFTYNISRISEQFNSIDKTEICINEIYNYQVMFFSNDKEIKCPF